MSKKTNLDVRGFLEMSVEEIFADRFSRYSKYIIQDRALPDIRDGLKPVQRRIVYSMNKEGNVFEKTFRKSAKTVGNVIGNYHPHGDTSVYEAMVRTSQAWKVNQQLVIMHGNNGSIDGDNAAAMRYTEAKLSKYAALMIKGIEEQTVDMIPNFDDTELEPTVLPSLVPNLLINGATGISSGYATDIPPHNAEEVIKAAIFINENPAASLEEIMEIVPAPDFPTGATIQGIEGIKQAFKTGKGKIVIQSKYEILRKKIKITEIPYEVNKAILLQKIDLIRIDKTIDGIEEVVDESDQNGLEISINLKEGANAQAILKFLLKNTDLQKNYNFNMTAINNKKPELVGIITMLKEFVNHRQDVITRRSVFRLKKANQKAHILQGLTLAVKNLDEVIRIIRSSQNKGDSKANLKLAFEVSEEQAEAIVMMQLYRLSNTDLHELEENRAELEEQINLLEKILGSNKLIKKLISSELKDVLLLVDSPRKSKVEKEITELKINQEDLIKQEDIIISISENGYIKRSSNRSYLSSTTLSTNLDGDQTVVNIKGDTKEKIIIFFNDGTYINIAAHELPDIKWKDQGIHLSTITKINDGVKVVGAINIKNYSDYSNLISISKLGYITKFKFSDLETTKTKQKVQWQKLKKEDEIVGIDFFAPSLESLMNSNVLIITNQNRYVNIEIDSLELLTLKRVGKKIARLKNNEVILSLFVFDKDILLFTKESSYAKLNPNSFGIVEKPTSIFKVVKSNLQEITIAFKVTTPNIVWITSGEQEIIENKTMTYITPEERLKSFEKNRETLNLETNFFF